jgi:CsoR family transcriptional regulator, copper-sensing transcriptional repressor
MLRWVRRQNHPAISPQEPVFHRLILQFAHTCKIPGRGILDIYPLWVYDANEWEGTAMDADTKKRVSTRVKRIAGQVAGVERMLAEDRYCVDVLQQIAAIRSALDAVGVVLISAHLESCVVGHGGECEHEKAGPMTRDELLSEVRTVLSQFLK